MTDAIFLIDKDGKLTEMAEENYQSEDLLQRFLENYPTILPGRQIDNSDPRRWLLVKREAGVPDQKSGADRWAVDHVFLDQDGIPTLVEVKRSSDTRLRREVVGQMLDYAANATAFWTAEKLRSSFEVRCSAFEQQATTLLAEFIGQDNGEEKFWEDVKTNLEAGRIRMIFVADEIPSELTKIIEFLNWQMNPAEVLGVEVRQFRADSHTVLVPRLLGQSTSSQMKKQGTGARLSAKDWDNASFLDDIDARCGSEVKRVAEEILSWANEKGATIEWGKGAQYGRFRISISAAKLLDMYTDGTVYLKLQELADSTQLGERVARDFLIQLRKFAGEDIPDALLSQHRAFSAKRIAGSKSRQFIDFLENIRTAVLDS
ncbi:hypothetical protein [Parvibaculum sp.]|uniref:hypothetical protein n=1 Tax=Parvibaculum sp. TaxID=2024848 RepID=UPI00391C8EC5